MALQKNLSLLLLLLLTLLRLALVQASYSQFMHQRFLRQHVDSTQRGGTSLYCNKMMETRGMTRFWCKQFNTFIHADIAAVNNTCSTPNIRCKNGMMNCHEVLVRVTDCKLTASSLQKCIYQGSGSSRSMVIACAGNPPVPVHFDR